MLVAVLADAGVCAVEVPEFSVVTQMCTDAKLLVRFGDLPAASAVFDEFCDRR